MLSTYICRMCTFCIGYCLRVLSVCVSLHIVAFFTLTYFCCFRQGLSDRFFTNFCSYRGEFRRGRRHGAGYMVSPNGAQFEGWFRDGVPNGDGILTWPDGGKFIGKYVAGKVKIQICHVFFGHALMDQLWSGKGGPYLSFLVTLAQKS